MITNLVSSEGKEYIKISEPVLEEDIVNIVDFYKNGTISTGNLLIEKQVAMDNDFMSKVAAFKGLTVNIIDDCQPVTGINVANNEELECLRTMHSVFKFNGGDLGFAKVYSNGLIEEFDFDFAMNEYAMIKEIASEINNAKSFGDELSPLEKYYYAYLSVLSFEEKKKLREEVRGKFKLTTKDLNDKFWSYNPKLAEYKDICSHAEMLCQILNAVGVPCILEKLVKKIYKDNGKYLAEKKYSNSCLVFIDDEEYGLSGVYHAIPKYDNKNFRGAMVGHSLLRYRDLLGFLRRYNKTTFVTTECLIEKHDENERFNLKAVSGLDLEELANNLDDVKKLEYQFDVDMKLHQAMLFGIKDFMGEVKDLLKNGSDVNSVENKGEAEVVDLSNAFKLIFKNVCKTLKFNEVKDNVDEETRSDLQFELDDLSRDLKLEELRVRELCAGFGNVRPEDIDDEMQNTLYESNFFNQEFAEIYDDYKSNKKINENKYNLELLLLDKISDTPRIPMIEDILRNVLVSMGKTREEAESEIGAIIFASNFGVGKKWDKSFSSRQFDNEFYEVLKNSGTKREKSQKGN